MIKKTFATLALPALCAFALLPTQAFGQNNNPKPQASRSVKHAESRPLRDLPATGPEVEKPKREHPVKPIPQPEQRTTSVADPGLQTAVSTSVATGASSGFDGVGVPNYAVNAAPPDTNGAIGKTQYVQWVNEAYAVYDKATGGIYPGFPKNGNTIWSALGANDPCAKYNDGDPIVQYDKAADRWVLTQFAVTVQPYVQCVAVSKTGDATGAYSLYEFSYGTQFNDYPKVGVWPDAYYVTYNLFNNGQTFSGGQVCAWDRAKMIAGAASVGQVCFNVGTAYGGLLPSDLDGATATLTGPTPTGLPPAGSPNYVMNFGSNSLNVWKFHVDWANTAASTLTGPTSIAVNAFTRACNGGTCITQPGTSQQLDSLADRLMYRLAYRHFPDGHEAMVVNHAVTAGPTRKTQRAGIRWYELRITNGTPSVFQQGTFSPDGSHRWMGSAAMDKAGNIGVGYSISSSSIFPSVYFTGRNAGDPAGTLQAETSLLPGAGSQTQTLARWGDYSSLSVDPVDDCTMWYTTEYLKRNGTFNWSTWIGKTKFSNCQ